MGYLISGNNIPLFIFCRVSNAVGGVFGIEGGKIGESVFVADVLPMNSDNL